MNFASRYAKTDCKIHLNETRIAVEGTEAMGQNELANQINQLQAIADKQLAEQQAVVAVQEQLCRTKQIELGSCNITPLPCVATQPFRSDLTVEQNSLFVANRYKGNHFTRTWTIKHPDLGEPVLRKVTVGKVHAKDRARGILKQTHQDAFYRLLQLWAEYGYSLGTVDGSTYGTFTTSSYRLVQAIRGDDSSTEYQRTQSILRDLAATPIVLENVYTWQGFRDRLECTLLNGVSWKECKVDSKTRRPKLGGKSEVTILFSDMVTESFLHKHVKTLLGEPYQSLASKGRGGRGELARLLYPYLDAQLAKKDSFHIRLKALAERFGFSSHQYKSYRKRKFDPAVRILNGKLIQSENYRLRISLKESADGTDYVLTAKREQNRHLKLFQDID